MAFLPEIRFKPANVCIYCGSLVELTDEHIIPSALDGRWVLPLSSCRDCARITSGFESRIINLMRDFRSGLNVGARRRKTSPKSGNITTLSPLGRSIQHKVNLSDHPLIIVFPVFDQPGILKNQYKTNGIITKGFEALYYGKHPRHICQKLNTKQLELNMVPLSNDFARLVAKVAYSYASAWFGSSAFKENFISDIILGKCNDIGQWVGCYRNKEVKVQNPNLVHRINLEIKPVTQLLSSKVVFAHLQLFCNSQSPGYVVAIGKLGNNVRLPDPSAATEPFPNFYEEPEGASIR